MILPLVLLREAAEDVEDARVVLVVHLVHRRLVVLSQAMVEPLPRLLNARLPALGEELNEEVRHVVVGEEHLGRADILVVGTPDKIKYYKTYTGNEKKKQNKK